MCPGVLELADGVTLTAETITLTTLSRLRLGVNSKVLAVTFTSAVGSWIEGLGTIQAGNATIFGLVTPGFTSGAVYACKQCFPHAPAQMVYGDLMFTGSAILRNQSRIFMPFNRPTLFAQPASRTNVGANWSSVSFESVTLDGATLQLDLPLDAMLLPLTQPPSSMFTWNATFTLVSLDMKVLSLCEPLKDLCASSCPAPVGCPNQPGDVVLCPSPLTSSSLSILFGAASCQPAHVPVSSVCSPACVHGTCNTQFLVCICDLDWNGTSCNNASADPPVGSVPEYRLSTGAIVGISIGVAAFGESC